MRALHEQETNERVCISSATTSRAHPRRQISEQVEHLVNLLKRDESAETKNDGIIDVIGNDDDEDDRIEEV